MPKLNRDAAKRVAEAEKNNFKPLDDGVYHVRLVDVDGSGEGPAGPYWTWEFDVVEPGVRKAKLWTITSLSEAADFKLKETFEAFGVDTDTDTDDLIGGIVRAVVSTRTIQKGARKGELANQIDRLKPAVEDFDPDGDPGASDDDDAPEEKPKASAGRRRRRQSEDLY